MVAEEIRERLLAVNRELAAIAGQVQVLDSCWFAEMQGYCSTGDWLRHECRLSWGLAYDLAAVGEQWHNVGQSVVAVEAGEIGFGHAAHIARTCQRVEGAVFDEARLIEEARDCSVSRFWHICMEFRHATDPHGAAREQAQQHEMRALRFHSREDGMVALSGLLDPAGGAMVHAALQPLAERHCLDDERTPEQRLADALVEVVGRSTQTHVHVSATLGTLLQMPHVAPADIVGHLVPSETLRRLTCEGSVSRMLFDTESVLIDAGRERRVVSPQQRRALEVRDGHCRWPGCMKRASWCDAHHLVHWAVGGATNLSNLVLLCGFHHRLLHEGTWNLFLKEDGQLQPVRRPLDLLAPPRPTESLGDGAEWRTFTCLDPPPGGSNT